MTDKGRICYCKSDSGMALQVQQIVQTFGVGCRMDMVVLGLYFGSAIKILLQHCIIVLFCLIFNHLIQN